MWRSRSRASVRVTGQRQRAEAVEVEQQVPAGVAADSGQKRQDPGLMVWRGGLDMGGQRPLRSLVQPRRRRVLVRLSEQHVYVAADQPHADDLGAPPTRGHGLAEVPQS
jgi:hypothetical protein